MSASARTLPSGLRVIADPTPGVKTAALSVYATVGSRHERKEEHGLSHLIEHMAFKGTRRRSALAIAQEIESVGGELDAATSVENTIYEARVLAEDVEGALDILSDILIGSVFDPQELEREKKVILQEIDAAQDAPDDLIFDLFTEAAFANQAIGRAICGDARSVSSFGPGAIRDYLGRHYGAETFIISAAGAVDGDRLAAAAERMFADAPRGAISDCAPARYVGGEKKTKRALEQLNLVMGFEGVSCRDPDDYAVSLFVNAVGDGMSSRLFQEVREKRGLAYSIYAFHWAFADTGLFGVSAAVSPADGEEVLKVALDCLRLSLDDLREDELRRAKAQMKVGMLRALESPAARADHNAHELHMFDRLISYEEAIARIEAVSVGDARRAGARLLASAPTLAALGPSARAFSADRICERLRTG